MSTTKKGKTKGKRADKGKAKGAAKVKAAAKAAASTSKKPKKPAGEKKTERVSALDAAATVLEKTAKAMTCGELIQAMDEQGLWTSPGGKTPASTLYSAISREINKAGKDSRFRKGDRGQFGLNKA